MRRSLPAKASPLPARRWRDLLVGLGGAVVLVLFASSFWQAASSLRALDALQLQAERQSRLDSMLTQLVEAESAVRGYLLSRKDSYLEPYFNSLKTIEYTLEQIRRDVGSSPAEQEALAQLTGQITLKLRILSDSVSRRTAGEEAPRGQARSEGLRYMESIRETVGLLRSQMAARGQRSLDQSITHVRAMRWVVGALSGGAALLLFLLVVVQHRQFLLRERIDALLRSENDRLEAQVKARTAELSELASHLTRAREDEQARLAHELHDELGALLTAAKMDAGWIARTLPQETGAAQRERFERLQATLDEGIALKRRITDDLRPPLLQELGLTAALRGLGEEFARHDGVALELDLPDEEIELPPANALALYRIAQEALTNVRRHAQARHATLHLVHAYDSIALTVEDDGAGFDPTAASRHRHGLAGMRHRVQMFAGSFAIDSAPGRGTRISVSLPLVATADTVAASY